MHHPGDTLLRRTLSLCPATLEEVPARVVRNGRATYLLKEDRLGRAHRVLLGDDPRLPAGSAEPGAAPELPFTKLMVDVTTRCNLRCPVCYRRPDPDPDPSLTHLRRLAASLRNRVILLCGGEPTLRDDLTEIIRAFSRRNAVFLVTNGLRLADAGYLDHLVEAGLRHVSISINGLEDRPYQELNGAPLWPAKEQALDNLRRRRVGTVASFMLAPGVNEDQLAPLARLCLERGDHIHELRVRSMAPVGDHLEAENLGTGALLDIACRELGLERDEVLRELDLKRAANALAGRELFALRGCSLDFHLRRAAPANRFDPVGRSLPEQQRRAAPAVAADLVRAFGLQGAAVGAAKAGLGLERLPWFHRSGLLKVGLRSWPDARSVDLCELGRCQTAVVSDAGLVPFCLANIRRGDSQCAAADAGPTTSEGATG